MSRPALPLPPWLGRALVEGGLIVFAVVLGFIVNEWRESVADHRAAEAAMNRVVAEVEANIAQLEAVVEYHEDVVSRIGERLAEIEAGGDPVVGVLFDEMPGIMPSGINAPSLSRFAWDHAQQHGRLDVLPYEIVAGTARVYEIQADGADSTWRKIVDLIFAGPEVMRPRDIEPSLRFTQIGFAELAAQERFLIDLYRRLLDQLHAEGFEA